MVKDRPLREFLAKVARKESLTFSTWGRDEWHAVFGERDLCPPGAHFYFDRLCRELGDLLQSRPAYHLGVPADLLLEEGGRISAYLSGLSLSDLDWTSAAFTIDTVESARGLLHVAAGAELVMVGHHKLGKLRRILRPRAFIDVPPRNPYLCKDDIVRNTLASLEDIRTPALITVSAGVATPLVVDALHARIGKHHQLVGAPGLWGPLA